MKIKTSLILVVFTLSPIAADQFAYVSPKLAKEAVVLLKKEKDLLLFCEPCNELQGKVVRINSVTEADVNYEGKHEVSINGAPIDLAYTFVRRHGRWRNLAIELALNPTGVSTLVPFSNPKRKPEPDI